VNQKMGFSGRKQGQHKSKVGWQCGGGAEAMRKERRRRGINLTSTLLWQCKFLCIACLLLFLQVLIVIKHVLFN